MRNDLIFILKNVEWKSENKKKRDTEISEDQYIIRFTRREPYTDFICMTEGKNSEAHVKHVVKKKILHIIILKRMN